MGRGARGWVTLAAVVVVTGSERSQAQRHTDAVLLPLRTAQQQAPRSVRDDGQCDRLSVPADCPTLADAQSSFYNARYARAAALTLALPASEQDDPAIYELRASAGLFQLKSVIGERADRSAALAACTTCPELIATFFRDTTTGQMLARTRLLADAGDEAALFFLGKLDLNYLWLQLGLLGHRTGWNEFREARRSLDAVLQRNRFHVRARVARAWIDYIVDTTMPRGTKWVLGGGNKDRALLAVRQAVNTDTEFFSHAEAAFSLWDMQVREGRTAEAIETARELGRVFPENRQLVIFLEGHEPGRAP